MIGLYGGTFDPVHYGHLRSAWEVREALHIDDFRLLPAGQPPHRDTTFSTADDRLAMLKLATLGLAGLRIDDREVRRPGPSYMADTLEELRGEADTVPLLLIVGQDSAAQLDRWHRWKALFQLAHIVIMRRPGRDPEYRRELSRQLQGRLTADREALAETPAGLVWHADVSQLEISSSGIRELLRTERSPRFLLPDSVLEYILRNRLYGAKGAGAPA